MKILQVMAGGTRGGAETAFVDMCIALHEHGETIEVVTRPNDLRVPQLRQAGITVHTAQFGGRIDIFTRRRIRKIIEGFKPDIVQTWMARAAWHTPGWAKGMQAPRYKVVSRLGGYYKTKYFASADYFTVIAPAIGTYLVEHGIAAERVRHINNFAETEEAGAPVNRAAHDTPQEATLLLALGRLHPTKALDTLISAVAQLPAIYLWIAGEGPLRGALEKQIADLGVGMRVKLLGWRSDRAALLAACDICVFPSRYEPFGTVFVQAWGAQRPVITSNADGPRQFVRDGEDGLMVPIDDVAALKEAIGRLAGDKALQARLVERGFSRYQGEFTKEKTVRAYLDFYKEIQ